MFSREINNFKSWSVTPFEDIRGDKMEEDKDIRSILALDHEHPTLKYVHRGIEQKLKYKFDNDM